MDSQVFSKITFNVSHYGLVVLTLEVARRCLAFVTELVCKNRKQGYKEYLGDLIRSPVMVPQVGLLTFGYVTSLMLIKATHGETDEMTVSTICLTSLLVLVFYTNMHRFLVMTPEYRKNLLRHQLHNIGPGLARCFAKMIKLGLKDPKVTSDSLYDYMSEQEIGEFSKLENVSDFMTDKLVILFPSNLLEFCENFEEIKKEAGKDKEQQDLFPDANYQWCPVNSQGLRWHDLIVRKKKNDEKRLETAKDLSFRYEMSGNTRSMTFNVFAWTDKRGNATKTWYFKSFDNKPLENLIEWHNFNKEKLSPSDSQGQDDLEREVQRQCDLYRECLEMELNGDPNCKDNYYILTYNNKLSDAMLDLEKMIIDRETKVGLKWKNA